MSKDDKTTQIINILNNSEKMKNYNFNIKDDDVSGYFDLIDS